MGRLDKRLGVLTMNGGRGPRDCGTITERLVFCQVALIVNGTALECRHGEVDCCMLGLTMNGMAAGHTLGEVGSYLALLTMNGLAMSHRYIGRACNPPHSKFANSKRCTTCPICSHARVCKQNFEKWLQWLYLMDVIHPWGYGKLESR